MDDMKDERGIVHYTLVVTIASLYRGHGSSRPVSASEKAVPLSDGRVVLETFFRVNIILGKIRRVFGTIFLRAV